MIRFIEHVITRRRLHRAHTKHTAADMRDPEIIRGSNSVASAGHTGPMMILLNTVQGTSHTHNPSTEPQTTSSNPRVGTGKSLVGRDGIEAWETK